MTKEEEIEQLRNDLAKANLRIEIDAKYRNDFDERLKMLQEITDHVEAAFKLEKAVLEWSSKTGATKRLRAVTPEMSAAINACIEFKNRPKLEQFVCERCGAKKDRTTSICLACGEN